MNIPAVLEEDRELKRVEAEARELERRLAAVRDLPKQYAAQIAERDAERERTVPPDDRLIELRRILEQESAIATRRETRNLKVAMNKSILLVIALAAAVGALTLWGLRVMAG